MKKIRNISTFRVKRGEMIGEFRYLHKVGMMFFVDLKTGKVKVKRGYTEDDFVRLEQLYRKAAKEQNLFVATKLDRQFKESMKLTDKLFEEGKVML